MTARIEAEFDSVDLAERAARVIRERMPELTAVYIRPVRSNYDEKGENWAWTREYQPGAENTAIVRELLPLGLNTSGFVQPGYSGGGLPVFNRPDFPVNEPDLTQSTHLSCLVRDSLAQTAGSIMRNLGGLHIRSYK